MPPPQMLRCTSPALYIVQEHPLMTMDLHALRHHTFLASLVLYPLPQYTFSWAESGQKSLLSSAWQIHTGPYLFMPLGPGKGKILWTEHRSTSESILRSVNSFDAKNDEK